MKTPLLSIIMPVYNAESYLKNAVNSVLSQSFCDFELICVNDKSTDRSGELLKNIAAADNRVVIIDSDINVGAGHARNLGIERASGTYLTFVDADDTVEPDLYERIFNISSGKDFDEMVFGLYEEHFDKNGTYKKSIQISYSETYATCKTDIAKTFLELENLTLFGYQWNSIYKSEIIFKNNIRFEAALFYEDFFFNLEVAKHINSVIFSDCCGYHYYKRVNNSVTHSFSKDYFDLSYRRIADMYSFCKENGADVKRMNDILGNRLLRYTLSALGRNNDAQSEMDTKDRMREIKRIASLPLYSELLPECTPENPAHGLLRFSILKRLDLISSLLGKAVYIFK